MHGVEAAYQRYQATVAQIARTGSWGAYADLFTTDAVFRRVGMPDRVGREAIRAMMLTDATTLPGSLITSTEVVWSSCDARRDQVVQELRHTMCDPGDGSTHFALSTSLLHYAGDDLWSGVDVVHSPHAYRTMYRGWARAARLSGRLEEAEQVSLHVEDPARPV